MVIGATALSGEGWAKYVTLRVRVFAFSEYKPLDLTQPQYFSNKREKNRQNKNTLKIS
jgi:hypothetical protein